MERITVNLSEEIVAGLVEEAKDLGCSPQALLNALARHGLAAIAFSPQNALSTPKRRETVAEDARAIEQDIDRSLRPMATPEESRGHPERALDAPARRRTYSRTSRARYGEQTLRGERYEEEIFVSLRDPDDLEGSYAEFAVRWYPLSAGGPTPRVECFSESAGFLLSCADLLAALRDLPAGAHGPDEVEDLLRGLGFENEDRPC